VGFNIYLPVICFSGYISFYYLWVQLGGWIGAVRTPEGGVGGLVGRRKSKAQSWLTRSYSASQRIAPLSPLRAKRGFLFFVFYPLFTACGRERRTV